MALRNVVQRRNHKERAQPAQRKKLGLLEKHKDYVERARDHHAKQDRLHRLRQKAALRNPDEFNFGMIRGASTSGSAKQILKRTGQHVERRTTADAQPLSNDLVAILKSQDVGYVRNAIRAEEKKIEQLKQRILPALGMLPTRWLDEKDGRRHDVLRKHGLVDAAAASDTSSNVIAAVGKKTVWVDSVEDARSYTTATTSKNKGKQAKYSLDEDDIDFDDDFDDDELSASEVDKDSRTKYSERLVGNLVDELASRQERLNALNEAREKLEVVRSLMTTRGTSARKVGTNETKLRETMANGGKVTANGLALPGPDEEEDSEDESTNKKGKRTVWKWGRERKR